MDQKDCFILGKITKSFGLKGEVVFVLDVDTPTDYAALDSVFVEVKGVLVPYFIESIHINGNKATVKFEDLSREESLALVGCDLYLPLTILPKLTGKKFYFHEIIGFHVVDNKKGDIGTIVSVIDYPAQPLFQIINNDKEILLPVIDQLIDRVDRDNTTIYVNAPDGLIDLYLEN
ncbi:MAG: 16S rRNA processing protein RimM [Bacteroidales bacterium]|nr:16S rRNA processing protein RimM [Bacteroidales bacterium]